jgi:hypothetical protein
MAIAARNPWRTIVSGALLAATAAVLVVVLLVAAATGTNPVNGEAYKSLGIPDIILDAYLRASARSGEIAPGCDVRPAILMGIGKVETNHGGSWGDAAVIEENGDVVPWIIGPTLNGEGGVAAIEDTDGGKWDLDTTWDHAVGPMQFIPTTWQAYGRDGNDDGITSPHNIYDATLATVAHLCLGSPGDYNDPDQLAAALYNYNHSDAYVAEVMEWIAYYDSFAIDMESGELTVTADGTYALPVARSLLSLEAINRPHHDYPAWDFSTPSGTPVFSVSAGTVVTITSGGNCGNGVIIDAPDGFEYVYCHASQTLVSGGATVSPGKRIMSSGDTGNSSGPHLHLQIRSPSGTLVCPQPLLEAWYQHIPLSPREAPTSGCVS